MHPVQLQRYVREDQPFGPPDAAKITEPDCAAALFDWQNTAFAELLKGSHVVIGRRGSGKSALLSTFRGKRFLNQELTGVDAREYRDRHHISAKMLIAVPDIIVEVDTPAEVDDLEQKCAQRHVVPPVEILSRMWTKRIWLLVAETIKDFHNDIWQHLPEPTQAYIDQRDLSNESISPADFISQLEATLVRLQKRCVVTFDNIERHKFQEAQNNVLAGLCAATGELINNRGPIEVKLCLPAEIFEYLSKFLFQPDKDFHTKQYLHWNAAELMHLAAHRLKVYLSLYKPEAFNKVKDMRLIDRSILRKFWRDYLPDTILNARGVREDTFTYILRHTQLLPRQLLTILNNIARRSARREEIFEEPFSDRDIIKGVEDSEETNKDAVLIMFEPLFPHIKELFSTVMPRLRRNFDYGYLQSIWNSSGRAIMEEMDRGQFRQFWRLMLSTGAIGVYETEQNSLVYHSARFEFNTKWTLQISDKDKLCVHPMFSRIYNIESVAEEKHVLPRGSDFRVSSHD